MLMQYDWPGNVRELKNVVERLVDPDRRRRGDQRGRRRRRAAAGQAGARLVFARGTPFKDLVAAAERDIILAALEANDHHISNTARELQLERSPPLQEDARARHQPARRNRVSAARRRLGLGRSRVAERIEASSRDPPCPARRWCRRLVAVAGSPSSSALSSSLVVAIAAAGDAQLLELDAHVLRRLDQVDGDGLVLVARPLDDVDAALGRAAVARVDGQRARRLAQGAAPARRRGARRPGARRSAPGRAPCRPRGGFARGRRRGSTRSMSSADRGGSVASAVVAPRSLRLCRGPLAAGAPATGSVPASVGRRWRPDASPCR